MQRVVTGRARSRSTPISPSHSSHSPYDPSSMRPSASSIFEMQLALAIADAQREIPVVLERGAVGGIGKQLAALSHAIDGADGLSQQLSAALV